VFSHSIPVSAAEAGRAKVIPEGTEVSIRTDELIDSTTPSPGQLYSATISEDVLDSNGAVALPRGSPAKLLLRNITSGGAAHSPELVLDLFSVTVNGKEHRVVTSDVDIKNRKGVGANRRTAVFAGGGAGLGALVGAILGGGKGAAIGAASGAGGGLVTQIFTRGKKIKVPAESQLIFRLDRTLVLRAAQ
jgi:outer membrane lipoprotein SlyB